MTTQSRQVGRAPILEEIERSQRSARTRFRLIFALVWLAIIAAFGVFLWVTEEFDWDFISRAGPYILQGAGLTILICASSIVLATILAIIGALGRLSTNAVYNGVASFYVSLVRGTPLLVQIFFIYFGLPQIGIILPAIPAGIIALGFNYGAYMTEIFRAGIQAVPPGQAEAAQALGMPDRLLFRRVVLPQAVRIVIPAIGNDFVAMIKDSALISTIGVQELLWRADQRGTREFRTLQALIIAALVYWALTIIFSFFQERLERRMARGDR